MPLNFLIFLLLLFFFTINLVYKVGKYVEEKETFGNNIPTEVGPGDSTLRQQES